MCWGNITDFFQVKGLLVTSGIKSNSVAKTVAVILLCANDMCLEYVLNFIHLSVENKIKVSKIKNITSMHDSSKERDNLARNGYCLF